MDDLMRKVGLGAEEMPYAEGLLFPATKDQILAHARNRHLPGEVIDRLEKIPDKKYSNIGELISEAAKDAV